MLDVRHAVDVVEAAIVNHDDDHVRPRSALDDPREHQESEENQNNHFSQGALREMRSAKATRRPKNYT